MITNVNWTLVLWLLYPSPTTLWLAMLRSKLSWRAQKAVWKNLLFSCTWWQPSKKFGFFSQNYQCTKKRVEKMSQKLDIHIVSMYCQLNFSQKIEVPLLGLARNLHSSARLELANSSSGSSLYDSIFCKIRWAHISSHSIIHFA